MKNMQIIWLLGVMVEIEYFLNIFVPMHQCILMLSSHKETMRMARLGSFKVHLGLLVKIDGETTRNICFI